MYKAMTELSKNSTISLVGGGTATIEKELGRGGQGIVYLVDVCGEKKALNGMSMHQTIIFIETWSTISTLEHHQMPFYGQSF